MKHQMIAAVVIVLLFTVTGCGPGGLSEPTLTATPTQTPTEEPPPVEAATATEESEPTVPPAETEETTLTPPADGVAEPKAGLWEAVFTRSLPSGSFSLSFQISSDNTITGLVAVLPTFDPPPNDMCPIDSADSFPIEADGTFDFSVRIEDANTGINFTGIFESETEATGEVVGVCRGQMLLFMLTFYATWISA